MKKLLVLIVLLSAPIFAENWDREQLNFKVQTKDVHYRYRHYFGESDKTHHQLGYKYDNWQFSYQYIEKKGRIEHRPRVSVKLFKQDNGFYFRPRVEYRDIEGKKGKYLPITITINDEVDQFGNNGPVIVEQTKEEREAKVAKVYLGNARVVWTNGQNVDAPPRMDQPKAMPKAEPAEEADLPF